MNSLKNLPVNPVLPADEYLADPEAHVFENRLYLYGFHDSCNGTTYCEQDYTCWSVPLTDLTNWRCHGVIFHKNLDPRNPQAIHNLWAPDVVESGGKYDLYYCLDLLPEIGFARADKPEGPFEFYDYVCYEDGQILNQKPGDLQQFDPGLFKDENTLWLYSGNAPMFEHFDGSHQNSQVMKLEADMKTIDGKVSLLLPPIRRCKGTSFEGYAFYKASSMKKIDGRYYLLYSSVRSHDLCYAVSDRPDGGFAFGGISLDIAQLGANNGKENVHGSLLEIDHQWYIVYHRHSENTCFSRQTWIQPVLFENGRFLQAHPDSDGMRGVLQAGLYTAGNARFLKGAHLHLLADQKVQAAVLEGKTAKIVFGPFELYRCRLLLWLKTSAGMQIQARFGSSAAFSLSVMPEQEGLGWYSFDTDLSGKGDLTLQLNGCAGGFSCCTAAGAMCPCQKEAWSLG